MICYLNFQKVQYDGDVLLIATIDPGTKSEWQIGDIIISNGVHSKDETRGGTGPESGIFKIVYIREVTDTAVEVRIEKAK